MAKEEIKAKPVTHLIPGMLVTFIYDAKTKDKLPFWDAVPLSFIIDVTGKHFLGLNLHYLPQRTRKIFLRNIMVADYERLKKGQKTRINWGHIKRLKSFKYGRAIIKKYLWTHLKSRIIQIDFEDWGKVLQTEGRWMKAPKKKVWVETLKLIKKYT